MCGLCTICSYGFLIISWHYVSLYVGVCLCMCQTVMTMRLFWFCTCVLANMNKREVIYILTLLLNSLVYVQMRFWELCSTLCECVVHAGSVRC